MISAGAQPKLTKSARLSSSAPNRDWPLIKRAIRPSMPSSAAANTIAASAQFKLLLEGQPDGGQPGAQREQRDDIGHQDADRNGAETLAPGFRTVGIEG